MFTNFHHASYLVPDLDAAIASYAETFGGRETGRGTVPGLGVVGFVQVGKVEVEFIQPADPADLASATAPAPHPVAPVAEDLHHVVADSTNRGYRFYP